MLALGFILFLVTSPSTSEPQTPAGAEATTTAPESTEVDPSPRNTDGATAVPEDEVAIDVDREREMIEALATLAVMPLTRTRLVRLTPPWS
jgi:predicted  nucleic acid-binding Zn-ribbon protein